MFAIFLLPFAIVAGVVMLARSNTAPATQVSGGAPSPIAVLCVFLRAHREPPAMVVQCAIAEARLIGRDDLACDLMQTFGPQAFARPVQPLPIDVASQDEAPGLATESMEPPPEAARSQEPQRAPAAMAFQMDGDVASPVGPGSRPGAPPSQVQIVPSPLHGVPDEAWSNFCSALVREAPTFTSQRHVGRYRHRKDRLAEIGFDPDAIANSPDAQDAALAADVCDAYKHLVASGLAKQHLGREISIPDVEGSIPLTLSGALGIASVAGLEGCAGWLESKADRKRFPHTTQAFLRTNGCF